MTPQHFIPAGLLLTVFSLSACASTGATETPAFETLAQQAQNVEAALPTPRPKPSGSTQKAIAPTEIKAQPSAAANVVVEPAPVVAPEAVSTPSPIQEPSPVQTPEQTMADITPEDIQTQPVTASMPIDGKSSGPAQMAALSPVEVSDQSGGFIDSEAPETVAPETVSKPKPTPKQVPAKPKPADIKPEVEQAPLFPVDLSRYYSRMVNGVPVLDGPKMCGTAPLELDITIDNVRNAKGVIVADLHDDKQENFLKSDKVVLRIRVKAEKDTVQFCMPLPEPGDYSVAIYHDMNANEKFDKNFLGLPKERFGISNNPKYGFRAPEYDESTFSVPREGRSIQITMVSTGDVMGGR